MIEIKELSEEKFIGLIGRDNELRDKLDNYIQSCELDYMDDKLRCFKRGSADYEIGFYSPSYLSVKNNEEFLDGVEKSVKNFGCSPELEKLIERTNKLRWTNLFDYYVEKVCEMFYKEELRTVIDYVEELSYTLYCNNMDEFLQKGGDSYLECFQDNYFDGTYYDEETDSIFTKRDLKTA